MKIFRKFDGKEYGFVGTFKGKKVVEAHKEYLKKKNLLVRTVKLTHGYGIYVRDKKENWEKTGKDSWYKKSTKTALWVKYSRGYHLYINEKGYIVFVGKTIPGRALYPKPKTKSQALEYAKDYVKKH